jgi:hypothetical protein
MLGAIVGVDSVRRNEDGDLGVELLSGVFHFSATFAVPGRTDDGKKALKSDDRHQILPVKSKVQAAGRTLILHCHFLSFSR